MLDQITWAVFVDTFPYLCMLTGIVLYCAGGVYVTSFLLRWLMHHSGICVSQIGRYLGWKAPRLFRRASSRCVAVINVAELLTELGIEYQESRVCMRWFKANKCKMPDYLEEITLLNEDE